MCRALDAKYPLNADFCLNWIRKGRDGCKSCDTLARLLIQKEEEEEGAADKQRLPRSEPLWPGYKRENPGPVCLRAGQQLVETVLPRPDHRNPFIVRNARSKTKRSPRGGWNAACSTHSSRPPSSSCVAARSCLFIGFTRQYGTAKKNISTDVAGPL